MTNQIADTALIKEAVAQEISRTEYPDGFPALPPMPAGRYFDPEFFNLEMQHVFKKSWLYAAHVSELPAPGSYKLFEQLGLSIIISRGKDNVIRAFRNICRHRGSALVLEPKGTARRFVCPYHAWGYSSEGQLVSVSEAQNFKCVDKSELPLLKVRCETWRGFVFINLDENAGQPLDEFLAPWAAQSADFPLEQMSVKGELVFELDCNWKVAYDNFLEIYHVAVVHARTLSLYLDSKSFYVSLFENGHGRFTTRKRDGMSVYGHLDGVNQGMMDFFKDYTVALPRFPNGFTALDPAGFNWQNFWPVSPNKMIMTCTLMGRTLESEEAERAYYEKFEESNIIPLGEDKILFPSMQRAMESGEFSGAVLGFQEQFLHWYNEQIDRTIGPDNIPAHLRVKQILAPFVQR